MEEGAVVPVERLPVLTAHAPQLRAVHAEEPLPAQRVHVDVLEVLGLVDPVLHVFAGPAVRVHVPPARPDTIVRV